MIKFTKYIMKNEVFENLATKYPLLFQKSKINDLGVGLGWLGIIDTLCGLISSSVEQKQQSLKFYFDLDIKDRDQDKIQKLEEEIASLIKDLPTILQIKEKFGGLRFYVVGSNNEYNNYIRFAESMSFHTCELCGAPGEARNDGWTKVLCEKHHKERIVSSSYTSPIYRTPKIPEE